MIVRDATPEDYPAILEIHAAMGMDYSMYDLESPLFVAKKVYEQDGKIVGACLLRITAETMLLLSPDMNPPQKMEAIEALQPEIVTKAWSLGLDEIEARIPQETEEIFQKRLLQLGWTRNREGWHPWQRTTLL